MATKKRDAVALLAYVCITYVHPWRAPTRVGTQRSARSRTHGLSVGLKVCLLLRAFQKPIIHKPRQLQELASAAAVSIFFLKKNLLLELPFSTGSNRVQENISASGKRKRLPRRHLAVVCERKRNTTLLSVCSRAGYGYSSRVDEYPSSHPTWLSISLNRVRTLTIYLVTVRTYLDESKVHALAIPSRQWTVQQVVMDTRSS